MAVRTALLLRPGVCGLRRLRPAAARRGVRSRAPLDAVASATLGVELDAAAAAGATPIYPVRAADLDGLTARLGACSGQAALACLHTRASACAPLAHTRCAGADVAGWAKSSAFKADAGKALLLPGAGGAIAGVLLGLVRSAAAPCACDTRCMCTHAHTHRATATTRWCSARCQRCCRRARTLSPATSTPPRPRWAGRWAPTSTTATRARRCGEPARQQALRMRDATARSRAALLRRRARLRPRRRCW
jgi:hypothetical protein